jgi:large subunit ribosomal protein L6
MPISVPENVTVTSNDRTVNVKGPKGDLTWTHRQEVAVEVTDSGRTVVVTRQRDDRICRSLHGLTRSIVANMVQGCLEGFSKSLEVYGVGYGVQLQGSSLSVVCGMSHPAVFEVPQGVNVDVTTPQARGDSDPARFTVSGPDKQAVGEFAARVRKARPPEPYKGKGIRYADEHVRRKVGKAFAGAGG